MAGLSTFEASEPDFRDFPLLQRALDHFPDGILLIGSDRAIVYANPAFFRLWRVPDNLMRFKNDFALLNHVTTQLADPFSFIREVERLSSSLDSSADELLFKDGRRFSRRSYAIREDDATHARVWVFSDRVDHRDDDTTVTTPGLRR